MSADDGIQTNVPSCQQVALASRQNEHLCSQDINFDIFEHAFISTSNDIPELCMDFETPDTQIGPPDNFVLNMEFDKNSGTLYLNCEKNTAAEMFSCNNAPSESITPELSSIVQSNSSSNNLLINPMENTAQDPIMPLTSLMPYENAPTDKENISHNQITPLSTVLQIENVPANDESLMQTSNIWNNDAVGSQIFASNQPANQTIALNNKNEMVIMDTGEQMLEMELPVFEPPECTIKHDWNINNIRNPQELSPCVLEYTMLSSSSSPQGPESSAVSSLASKETSTYSSSSPEPHPSRSREGCAGPSGLSKARNTTNRKSQASSCSSSEYDETPASSPEASTPGGQRQRLARGGGNLKNKEYCKTYRRNQKRKEEALKNEHKFQLQRKKELTDTLNNRKKEEEELIQLYKLILGKDV